MDLSFTPEQEAFVQACRQLLERECPLSLVRDVATPAGPGHSESLWKSLVAAGWLDLAFPEEFGGGGGSLFDLGLAYREAGRVLVPTTLYSTVHAALLIDAAGTAEQQRRWLPAIFGGDAVASVAFAEPHAVERLHLTTTRARQTPNGWVLDGVKAFVANARVASFLVVLAKQAYRSEAPRLGLFVVPTDHPGMRLQPYETFGHDAQFQAELRSVTVPEDSLLGLSAGLDGGSAAAFAAVAEKVTALQCMEMLGGIEEVLRRTADHVGERSQFGRPIGSFQAVQHHVANIAMRVEGGRTAAFRALDRVSDGRAASREVAVAKVWLGDTYRMATVLAHQLWGGMGYALETGLYLWSQRAKVTDAWMGGRWYHLDRLATGTGY
jgi:3-oxocholest-4-en-26-oyl-CoA dehydrogenase beta subunit